MAISVPNLEKISQKAAELWTFSFFQNGVAIFIAALLMHYWRITEILPAVARPQSRRRKPP